MPFNNSINLTNLKLACKWPRNHFNLLPTSHNTFRKPILAAFLPFLTVFALVYPSVAFSWSSSCQQAVTHRPALFDTPPLLFLWEKVNKWLPGTPPFILGQGHLGAVLLRLNKAKKLVVTKINIQNSDLLLNDRALLRLLWLLKLNGHSIGFDVAEVIDQPKENELNLNYVEGRTVHNLLHKSSSASEEVQREIRDAYHQKILQLKSVLELVLHVAELKISVPDKSYFMDEIPDGQLAIFAKNSPQKKIFDTEFLPKNMAPEDVTVLSRLSNGGIHIKSDNVIVSPYRDKNGELVMTIIDPY